MTQTDTPTIDKADLQRGFQLGCEATAQMAEELRKVYAAFASLGPQSETFYKAQAQFNLLPTMEELSDYLSEAGALAEEIGVKVSESYRLLKHLDLSRQQSTPPTEEVRSNPDLAADNERLREAMENIASFAKVAGRRNPTDPDILRIYHMAEKA